MYDITSNCLIVKSSVTGVRPTADQVFAQDSPDDIHTKLLEGTLSGISISSAKIAGEEGLDCAGSVNLPQFRDPLVAAITQYFLNFRGSGIQDPAHTLSRYGITGVVVLCQEARRRLPSARSERPQFTAQDYRNLCARV